MSDVRAEDPLAGQLADLDREMARLRDRADVGPAGGRQELETAIEELRVAAEELRVQQEQVDLLRAGQHSLRRQHEAMLAALPIPALTTGVDGIIRSANAAAAVLADSRIHRLEGKPVLTLFGVAARHDLRAALGAPQADGTTHRFRGPLLATSDDAVEVAVVASTVSGLAPTLTWTVFGEGQLPSGTTTEADLPQVLAQIATLPASSEDLQTLLDAAAGLTAGVFGPDVSLTVTYGPPQSPSTLSSTDSLAQQLDGLQMQTGEGPCVDAFASAGTVFTDDLQGEARWPALAAVAPGRVVSALAVPLRTGEEVVGALNVYSTAPGPTSRRMVTAEVLATAIGAVLHEHLLRGELLAAGADLERALASRAVIDQAKGIVMAERGCSAEDAFAHLARLGTQQGTKVRDVARDLVARRGGSAAPA